MKQDITRAIQFSNTFRYTDDLFSVNNVDFGNYMSAIYPLWNLRTLPHHLLKCVILTLISRLAIDTFPYQHLRQEGGLCISDSQLPHMDSNIPANPAYGVYISQLVRYARICTSKVDFINRLRGLSLSQTTRLWNQSTWEFINKFVNRHGLIVEKYGAGLREMRLAIQAWIAPSYPYI